MKIDLAEGSVGLYRDGTSDYVPSAAGPPRRVDGLTVGAPTMTRSAPHGGEMHPDGDELLYIVSGRVDVVMEREGGEEVVALTGGDACIVPKGIWHRVIVREPTRLVHLTPGPGGEHRPLR